MTVYIGSLICNFTIPKFPEKGTKEYDDFLKKITSRDTIEEENAPVAQPG